MTQTTPRTSGLICIGRVFRRAVLLATLCTGCVTTGKYDAALKNVAAARADSSAQRRRVSELETRITKLQLELDQATALSVELRKELERLGADVEALVAEKGALAETLQDTRTRFELLRRAQAAAEARAQLYRDLALRLKKMVDAGELSIALRDGRMVLQLSNDVLFDTGRVQIKPRGRDSLQQIASVLQTLQGRHFQVTGHTDNVPISNDRYASNWELSVARGLEVTRFLIAHGVAPGALAAAGYSEFDPVASNDTADGRARNRRIEIALQPNVEEMVAVPED